MLALLHGGTPGCSRHRMVRQDHDRHGARGCFRHTSLHHAATTHISTPSRQLSLHHPNTCMCVTRVRVSTTHGLVVGWNRKQARGANGNKAAQYKVPGGAGQVQAHQTFCHFQVPTNIHGRFCVPEHRPSVQHPGSLWPISLSHSGHP